MGIRIINMRYPNELNENEIMIKVDRTTVLGNPLILLDESDRNYVCDGYEEFFNIQLEGNTRLAKRFKGTLKDIKRVAQHKDIALACWCFPKRCHAETIKKYLEELEL